MGCDCNNIIFYGVNDVIMAWKEGLITAEDAKLYLKRVFEK